MQRTAVTERKGVEVTESRMGESHRDRCNADRRRIMQNGVTMPFGQRDGGLLFGPGPGRGGLGGLGLGSGSGSASGGGGGYGRGSGGVRLSTDDMVSRPEPGVSIFSHWVSPTQAEGLAGS